MKVSLKTPDFVVLDEAFSQTDFLDLNAKVLAEDFKLVDHSGTKVLSVSDGMPYRGMPCSFQANEPPFLQENRYRFLFEEVMKQQRLHFPEAKYDRVNLSAWCYTQGTALNWHDDGGAGYQGSFTYYAHREWKPTWGGNLFISEGDVGGRFIYPLPNRLVLMRRGIYHSIQRVDKNAGENCRLSLSGFFLRSLL